MRVELCCGLVSDITSVLSRGFYFEGAHKIGKYSPDQGAETAFIAGGAKTDHMVPSASRGTHLSASLIAKVVPGTPLRVDVE